MAALQPLAVLEHCLRGCALPWTRWDRRRKAWTGPWRRCSPLPCLSTVCGAAPCPEPVETVDRGPERVHGGVAAACRAWALPAGLRLAL